MNKENLKPVQPGQVLNPKGRPKGSKNRATILKRYLAATYRDKDSKTKPQPFGMDGPGLTVEESIELALISRALSGDLGAVREIKDTLHGKIPIKQELSGPDELPIAVVNVTNDVLGMLTKEQLLELRAKYAAPAENMQETSPNMQQEPK